MSVRKVLFVSVITLSVLAYSSTPGVADEHQEARQVAESVVKSFMAGYNAHDPKAISALFLPDAMLLGIDGKVTQGREAIESTYAATLKNLGGHFTVIIKDAIPLGDNVVIANDEIEIRDAGQNHDTIRGRAVITLAKTPDGWRYAAISAQKLSPSEGRQNPTNR